MSLGEKQRRAAGNSHRRGGNTLERGWDALAELKKLMPDRMRRAAARAGQAGRTTTHFLSGTRRKWTKMDGLYRRDASAHWRCPYSCLLV
jgi:hypothetical protein